MPTRSCSVCRSNHAAACVLPVLRMKHRRSRHAEAASLKIAQRFSAGVARPTRHQVPPGTKEPSAVPDGTLCCQIDALPSPEGLGYYQRKKHWRKTRPPRTMHSARAGGGSGSSWHRRPHSHRLCFVPWWARKRPMAMWQTRTQKHGSSPESWVCDTLTTRS